MPDDDADDARKACPATRKGVQGRQAEFSQKLSTCSWRSERSRQLPSLPPKARAGGGVEDARGYGSREPSYLGLVLCPGGAPPGHGSASVRPAAMGGCPAALLGPPPLPPGRV